MIERYTLPEMGKIWSDENHYQQMLQVEIFACEAMLDLGIIPPNIYETIVNKATVNLSRIYELNNLTKHDVVSFITAINENLPEEASHYLHHGLTASDVLDTTMSVQLVQTSELLLGKLHLLWEAIKKQALKHKYTLMIGRTHGTHAEPLSFGLKMALWAEEVLRHIDRLHHAKAHIAVGKLTGSVGNFANINPQVEEHVCRRLGLKPALVATQILQRDRHAYFINVLSLISCSLDKFATEIRNLQRSEIAEVEEAFIEGQKGSSAIPHKRNPVISERISGLSRVLRSYSSVAFENVVLWHERDLTHSSSERIIIPDACILLDYMLTYMTEVISNLKVNKKKMQENMEEDMGLVFSQRVFLALLDKGVDRDIAYEWVRKSSYVCFRERVDFEYLLMQDNNIMSVLSKKELDELFDYDYYTKYVDYIFSRTSLEMPID